MYQFSEHVLIPRQISATIRGGGGGDEPPSLVISAEGRSIEEAARSLAERIPRIMFLEHTRVVIIGEGVSRTGLAEVCYELLELIITWEKCPVNNT